MIMWFVGFHVNLQESPLKLCRFGCPDLLIHSIHDVLHGGSRLSSVHSGDIPGPSK